MGEQEEFEAGLERLAITHFRTIAKSVLISLTIFVAVITFTGSIFKATVISLCCLIFAAFNTWRRFLEPIVFVLFCAVVLYWCDPDIFQRAKTSIAGLSQAR